jgi:hypothetical protein
MKKIFTIFALFFLLSAFPVVAVTATPAAVATTSAKTGTASGSVTNKAKDLLDRVATKVAEIVQNERHSYSGTIKSKSAKASFVLTTPDSGDVTVTTNDATDFYRVRSGSQTDTNFASLKVSDDLAAIGTIDPQSKEMTARQIIVKIKRTNIAGVIESVDKNILTIKGQTGGSIKVDLTDAITLEKAGPDNKIVKGKIADFVTGQPVFAISYSPDSKTGTYSVLKAVTLTN